jgi:hypothetical protein
MKAMIVTGTLLGEPEGGTQERLAAFLSSSGRRSL